MIRYWHWLSTQKLSSFYTIKGKFNTTINEFILVPSSGLDGGLFVNVYNKEWEAVYPKNKSITKMESLAMLNELYGYISDNSKFYLEEIDFSDADNFSSMTEFNGVFYYNQRLKKVNLCNALFNNVINTYYTYYGNKLGLFGQCVNLEEINLHKATFDKATSAYFMFGACRKLETLDLASATFASVTDTSFMFQMCEKITSINWNNPTFDKVTDTSYMFGGCSLLTNPKLNYATFNVVVDIKFMFEECNSLTSPTWNNPTFYNVTNASGLFKGCDLLTNPKLSSTSFGNLVSADNMFVSCESITSINWNNPVFNKLESAIGMFQDCILLTNPNISYSTFQVLKNANSMFDGCTSIVTINWNNPTFNLLSSAQCMFHGCSSLTNPNLNYATFAITEYSSVEAIDTYGNKYYLGMFEDCTSLTTLNLSSATFNILTEAKNIFKNCTALKNITTNENSTFPVSIDLKWSDQLTYASMLSIAKWLKNYSNGSYVRAGKISSSSWYNYADTHDWYILENGSYIVTTTYNASTVYYKLEIQEVTFNQTAWNAIPATGTNSQSTLRNIIETTKGWQLNVS